MSSRARQPLPNVETLRVVSADGTEVAYDLHSGDSRSLVLIVPGFWREKRHPAMLRLARLLEDHGYRVAVADLRGHGESGGTFGFNRHEHEDVAAIVQDIRSRSRTASLTLLGFSYGGAITISAAARHDLAITGLVLISPVADFARLAPRVNPFTIHRHIALGQALRKPRFVWRARRAPKIRAVDDVGAVQAPICLIHVKNDWLVDHRHSVSLYDVANDPKELHIIDIPGNYHADRIFAVAGDRVDAILLDFLARTTTRSRGG